MKIKLNRFFKVTVVLIFSIALFFKISYKPVSACSCAPPGSPIEVKERSAAIFSGTVISQNSRNFQREVTFKVEQIWQGKLNDRVAIITPNNSAACGVYFKLQERYLVYAYNNDRNQLTTNSCSRTKLFSTAAEDLEELGRSNLPGAKNLGILNNSSWQLERFNERKIRPISNITVFFERSEISGNAGCNFYKAKYREIENRLQIGQFIITKRNCPGEIGFLEKNYLQALSNVDRFEIERSRLSIYYYDTSVNQGKLVYDRTNFR